MAGKNGFTRTVKNYGMSPTKLASKSGKNSAGMRLAASSSLGITRPQAEAPGHNIGTMVKRGANHSGIIIGRWESREGGIVRAVWWAKPRVIPGLTVFSSVRSACLFSFFRETAVRLTAFCPVLWFIIPVYIIPAWCAQAPIIHKPVTDTKCWSAARRPKQISVPNIYEISRLAWPFARQ